MFVLCDIWCCRVDDDFLNWLGAYVNEGIAKDIKSMQIGCTSVPDEFRHLMQLASSDLAEKLEKFAKRMKAAHEFLSHCGSKEPHHSLEQDQVQLVGFGLCLQIDLPMSLSAGLPIPICLSACPHLTISFVMSKSIHVRP